MQSTRVREQEQSANTERCRALESENKNGALTQTGAVNVDRIKISEDRSS